MGWKCKKCGKSSNSDNLNFPMAHGYICDGEVEPDITTTKTWIKVLS